MTCKFCEGKTKLKIMTYQAFIRIGDKEGVSHAFTEQYFRGDEESVSFVLKSTPEMWLWQDDTPEPDLEISLDIQARYCPMCGRKLKR